MGDIIVDEEFVPEEFFISDTDLPKWQYEKGAKKIHRVSKEGFEYDFSEGGMAFPDYIDRPSRTMITGEGGSAPSWISWQLSPIALGRVSIGVLSKAVRKRNIVSCIQNVYN